MSSLSRLLSVDSDLTPPSSPPLSPSVDLFDFSIGLMGKEATGENSHAVPGEKRTRDSDNETARQRERMREKSVGGDRGTSAVGVAVKGACGRKRRIPGPLGAMMRQATSTTATTSTTQRQQSRPVATGTLSVSADAPPSSLDSRTSATAGPASASSASTFGGPPAAARPFFATRCWYDGVRVCLAPAPPDAPPHATLTLPPYSTSATSCPTSPLSITLSLSPTAPPPSSPSASRRLTRLPLQNCIGFLLKSGRLTKIDSMVAAVVAVDRGGARGCTMTLADPTGATRANVHADVFDLHRIVVGAVLVLRRVSVFHPEPRVYLLNVVPNNVVRVLSPDDTLPATPSPSPSSSPSTRRSLPPLLDIYTKDVTVTLPTLAVSRTQSLLAEWQEEAGPPRAAAVAPLGDRDRERESGWGRGRGRGRGGGGGWRGRGRGRGRGGRGGGSSGPPSTGQPQQQQQHQQDRHSFRAPLPRLQPRPPPPPNAAARPPPPPPPPSSTTAVPPVDSSTLFGDLDDSAFLDLEL